MIADTSTAASHPPKAKQNIIDSINGARLVNTGSLVFMQSSNAEEGNGLVCLRQGAVDG